MPIWFYNAKRIIILTNHKLQIFYAKTILEAKVRIRISQVTGTLLRTKNEDKFCKNPSNLWQMCLKKYL